MSEHGAHRQVEMGSDRNFGLVFAAFFALVGLLPFATGHGGVRWWALLLAAGFLVVALVASRWLAPLNRVWFRFGLLLGKIVSPLLLSLVFFVVVTPLALVARTMGRDILQTRREARQRNSHWVARIHDPEHPSSMRNQY